MINVGNKSNMVKCGNFGKHEKHGQMGKMIRILRKYTVVNMGNKSTMVKWERDPESQELW